MSNEELGLRLFADGKGQTHLPESFNRLWMQGIHGLQDKLPPSRDVEAQESAIRFEEATDIPLPKDSHREAERDQQVNHRIYDH